MAWARVGGELAVAGRSTLLGLPATYAFVIVFSLAGRAFTPGVARRPPVADPSAAARGGRAERPAAERRVTAPTRWGELKDGLRYVLTTPRLLAPMWLAFLLNLPPYPPPRGLPPPLSPRPHPLAPPPP